MVVIAIMVVVMIVPVAVAVPVTAVLIPPSVVSVPAPLAGLMQLVAGAIRLSAVPTMVPDGLVELVIRLGEAMLAIIVIGNSARGSSKEQESPQCGRGQ